MRLVYQYDEAGLLVSTVFLEQQDPIPSNCTSTMPSPSLKTKPKWDGETWIESGIQLENYPEVKAPSATQQLLMQHSQQITLLQSMTMQQNQANAKLQSANEQQVTQIKQLQQMFMTANQQQAVASKKGDNQQ